VLVVLTVMGTFYMGGGGVTYNLRNLNSNAKRLANQLINRISPFSLSASLSQHRNASGKIISCIVAILLITTFVLVGFEINESNASAWESVHLLTLGTVFFIASCVSLFAITNTKSVIGRPHLISTVVLMLSIPIVLVYIAMKTDDTIQIVLFVIAFFMFMCMCVLVYSSYVTSARLLNSIHGHPENRDQLIWAHIKNGVTIGAMEINLFTLIAITMGVFGFANIVSA